MANNVGYSMGWKRQVPVWMGYVFAVLAPFLMIGLRIAASPYLSENSAPFFMAAAAVALAAFFGGLGPGLLATALTTIAGLYAYIFPSTQGLDSMQSRIFLGSQVAVCTLISLLCGSLKGSELAAAQSADQEKAATQKLNVLLESITDAFIAVDRELRITTFNRVAGILWNLSREHIGTPLATVLPSDTYQRISPLMQRAREQNVTTSGEIVDEGLQRSFEVLVFPNPDGKLIHFRDVSDRVAQAQALIDIATQKQQTAALFDSLFQNAPVGFAFFDRDGRWEKVNPLLAETNGLPVEDHFGKRVSDMLPSLGPTIKDMIERVVTTGASVADVEITGYTLQNSEIERTWSCGFFPVFDGQKKVQSVGIIVVDVTQRKVIDTLLRESEERFRSVADQSPFMIWLCNVEAKASWYNRSWLDYRGVPLEDALTESCFEFIHPEDSERILEIYRQAFKEEMPFTLEYRTVDGDGHTKWLRAHGSPIKLDNSPSDTYIVSCDDITDRKEAEENMRRILSNERAARSDAEKANRVKDEFVATLSHELRTPLTTMLGWAELLRNEPVNPQDLTIGLEAIEKSTRQQMQMINDLLDMSRISSGVIKLQLEFVSLSELVHSAVDHLRPTADAKGIQINFEESEDEPVVRVDPDRFSQIIWNLLTNAVKFTPEKGVITVSISSEEKVATFKIRDNGEGIDERFLPHVFDRFRQADGTISRRHTGLGLGLSIAKQLTELHAGTIWAESPGPNLGSTFIVSLPKIAWQPGQGHAENQPPPDLASKPINGVRIGLVEDDDSSRILLTRILEGAGATVFTAVSASKARELLADVPIDVLLSDIGIPDEDGLQMIRKLRQNPSFTAAKLPAAALTAFATEDDRRQALESGFQLHLTKPITTKDLVSAVQELQKLISA